MMHHGLSTALVVGALAGGADPHGVEAVIHSDGFEPPTAAALVRAAVEASGVLRLSIVEHWYTRLEYPASLDAMGFADPYPAGPAQATLQSGVLLLDFSGDLAGEQLAIAAWLQAGTLRFACGHAPPPVDATLLSDVGAATLTTLADDVLPDACRSEPSATTLVEAAWAGASGARLAIAEHWVVQGALPASLAATGLIDPLPVARARAQVDDGVLVLHFAGALDGERLGMALWDQSGNPRWVCGHAPPPLDATLLSPADSAQQTSLPEAWLPAACRGAPSPPPR